MPHNGFSSCASESEDCHPPVLKLRQSPWLLDQSNSHAAPHQTLLRAAHSFSKYARFLNRDDGDHERGQAPSNFGFSPAFRNQPLSQDQYTTVPVLAMRLNSHPNESEEAIPSEEAIF